MGLEEILHSVTKILSGLLPYQQSSVKDYHSQALLQLEVVM